MFLSSNIELKARRAIQECSSQQRSLNDQCDQLVPIRPPVATQSHLFEKRSMMTIFIPRMLHYIMHSEASAESRLWR